MCDARISVVGATYSYFSRGEGGASWLFIILYLCLIVLLTLNIVLFSSVECRQPGSLFYYDLCTWFFFLSASLDKVCSQVYTTILVSMNY